MRSTFATVGAAVLIATSAVLMTACNDKTGTPVPVTSVSAAPQGAGQPGATKPGGVDTRAFLRSIGKTGWYEGFEITIDQATVTADGFGGAKIRVDITYKNTTTANKTLAVVPAVQIGGAIDGGAGWNSPEVPGKGSATGDITASVKSYDTPEHLLDTITILYGSAAENQTRFPLKTDAKVESIAPRTLDISGKLTQDQTTVEITGATLTPSYTKNEAGKMELALRVKFIGGAGIAAGGTNISYTDFSAKTPAGSTEVADFRGAVIELLGRNQTIDKAGDVIVFLVPSPGTGPYTLSFDAAKGEKPAGTLSFTVS
ncbi:hypothetical protein ACFV4K_21925 [Nocardia sp. NPDC059764]|uniref:hypothetical protein n=1 Tax=Nocardia sp. NPDC059764 TaxID=3346939 RepID=UPI0036692CEC